jgi:hypothetical protein
MAHPVAESFLGIDEHACIVFKFDVLAATAVKGVRFG